MFAKGKYLKWCACDDYMSPNYLGACVAALDGNPDSVLAFGTTQHIDEEGCPIVGRGRRTFPRIDDRSPAHRFRLAVKNSFWTVDQEIFGLFRLIALRQTTLQRPYWGSDHALLKEMALLGRFIHVPDITFYNREHRERASHISDSRGRQFWQAPQSRSKHAFESWKHLWHLGEIAFRHRRIAPLTRTLPCVVGFAFSPRQFSRCVIEALSVVLPRPVEEGIQNVARSLFPPPSFDVAPGQSARVEQRR